MCDRWLNSFEMFLEDMGLKPSPRHSLERLDNEKGYEPSNTIWATQKQQMRNRRVTIFVEYQGAKIALIDLAETLGLNYASLAHQYRKRKLPIDQAIAKCRELETKPLTRPRSGGFSR